MANKIPVYMVNGFLESGKTTFIQETLSTIISSLLP